MKTETVEFKKSTGDPRERIVSIASMLNKHGHDIPLIISRYDMQAFEVMDNFINVTIPFNPSVRTAYPEPHADRKVVMNEAQQSIYDFLRLNPDATVDDMTGCLEYRNWDCLFALTSS